MGGAGKYLGRKPRTDAPELQRMHQGCARLGVALIVFGFVGLGTLAMVGNSSIMLLSCLVVISGIAEAVHAFYVHGLGWFFFHIVPGVAGVPVGLLIATHPDAGITAWTLAFASFFTVVGLFRLISAVRLKFPNWRWAAFDAVVTLVLGAIFWTTWSWPVTWFFGLAVGLSLILRGWSSLVFALAIGDRGAPPQTQFPMSAHEQEHSHTSACSPKVEVTNLS